jgi:hypothetical protein
VTGNVFAERFQFYFLTTNIAIRNNLFPSCYLNAIFPLSFVVMIRRDTFYLSFFYIAGTQSPGQWAESASGDPNIIRLAAFWNLTGRLSLQDGRK